MATYGYRNSLITAKTTQSIDKQVIPIESHKSVPFLPLYYTIRSLVTGCPTLPARHLFRQSLQSVAVAVSASLAVQTPQQVVFLLRYHCTSRYTRFRHMSSSAANPASVNSASFVWTNADFVAYSFAAMADYVSTGEGSVAHFPTVHTPHLCTGVGTYTGCVSKLLTVEAL